MRYGLILILLIFATAAQAQLSGVVKDGDKPIPGADVFIRNSSFSTITDENGSFALTGIDPGFVELIVYKNGYQLFKSPVRIQDGKAFKLTLKLLPETADPVAATGQIVSFLQFSNGFLGTSPSVLQCKIVNFKALQSSGSTGKISFKEPLVIENGATGYRIACYFGRMEMDLAAAIKNVTAKFDTLIARNPKQQNEWNQRRDSLYFGSRQHFFWSLANSRKDQGFELSSEKGALIKYDSILSNSKLPGYRKIKLPGTTIIHFHNSSRDASVNSSIAASDAMDVNLSGDPLNEKLFEITGAMNRGVADWIPSNYFPDARMEDLNKARAAITLLQEKIHLHSDKPYYYPGEPLWFKGYITCYVPEFRDSLSRVMYVELITPDKEILLSKTLKIDGGSTCGDFILPDSLKAGTYYLRAYTNLMKNFGDDAFFVKPIPVVNLLDKVEPSAVPVPGESIGNVVISPGKPTYKAREKITLVIRAQDENDKPIGSNLSISVTDLFQVTPIPEPSIFRDLSFRDSITLIPAELTYRVETGIAFSGQFFNDKGKKEPTNLNIVQGKFEETITRQTDANGGFLQTGYVFYDTVQFSILGKTSKGKAYGKVEIEKRQIPPMNFSKSRYALKLTKTNQSQRIVSDYEVPKSVKVLQEVTVKGSRIQSSEFITLRYGRPNRLISGDKLPPGDMLNSLMAAIPGLKVNYSQQTGITASRMITMGHGNTSGGFRGSSVPIPEPLIYVNDVYRGGGLELFLNQGLGAVNALMNIDPSTVDHVEVLNSPNGIIANELSQGRVTDGSSGLIAIYTKKGTGPKSFDTFSIPGYSRTRPFAAPDYDNADTNKMNKDFRSTIYWNPSVKTSTNVGEATLTFFAADLPGKYRIVVEGVTDDGKAVHCEKMIEVEEK